jgi:transposase
MESLLIMRDEEIDKLRVIREVIAGKLSWREAGERLQLSVRQIGYLCARIREEGNRGIMHGLRGKPSNHRLEKKQVERAVELVRQHYGDFGPTLANEKLSQQHQIRISTSALRQKMREAGLWKGKRSPQKYRAMRQRRSALGMLVQLDGSEHDWLEGRGPRCVLVVYIDDASSRVLHAEFVESEDTLTLLRTTRQYLQRYGRPVAFYVDKDSIYKVNRAASIEEQLKDREPMTQFGRAIEELGIEVIHAHSPQAKGRVERGFQTHQDRLVKELRLAGITTLEAANAFLWDSYLAAHNARFAVEPCETSDAHRPLLPSQRLEQILSLRLPRTVLSDFTIRFENRYFQLLAHQPVRVGAGDKVEVERRLEGSLQVRFKQRYLNVKPIEGRPAAVPVPRPSTPVVRRHRPVASHPWKQASFARMLWKKGKRGSAAAPSGPGLRAEDPRWKTGKEKISSQPKPVMAAEG